MIGPGWHTSAVLALCMTFALSACSGDSRTKLTVFAASSLTEVFGRLEQTYEDRHPGVDVVISYGSSSTLADQIAQGAPADVIATADEQSLSSLARAEALVAAPQRFATNTLAVVTPPDNPAEITGIADLTGTDFVICDPSAPCGAGAEEVLRHSGVTADPKSLEPDVKSVLAKVTLGEADAGIVYVTDAQAAGDDVVAVAIDAEHNVINSYFVAAVRDTSGADDAAAWIALLTSRAGRSVLTDAGFGVR